MSTQTYRKKPVVIEALQVLGGMYMGVITDFIGDDGTLVVKDGDWFIRTLEGDMKITAGDWIIKGIAGEFYPCKPDIFEATYEPVSS